MSARSAAIVAFACGLVLTAAPLAYSMFERTGEAERILDRFTFLTQGDNPDRHLAEAEITRERSNALVGDMTAGLAADAGIGETQLVRRYPDPPIAFSVWLMVGSGFAMSIGAGLALLRARGGTSSSRVGLCPC